MEKGLPDIRRILFLGILFLLAAPFIQGEFGFVELEPLKGDIKIPEKGSLTMEGWLSGEYQKQQEIYLNETFGFRNLSVRINNQIAFNLFKKAKANNVVIGKENYLYGEGYIHAYFGSDYIGDDSTMRRMQQLKYIQDTLNKLDKDLIVVMAAGKGSYYPEYIPDKFVAEKHLTNHDAHVSWAKKLGVNLIDFQRYFIENKHKSQYPLYPKYGIHWSYYGMCLVADSMIRYIENRRNIDMPNLFWDKVNMAYPKESDYDVGDGMNLMFKLKSESLAYPEVQVQSDSGKTKPSILVISDSFYWGIYGLGFQKAFSTNHFWFYNKEVFPESDTKPILASELNLADEIAKHDVIIIMATDAKLSDFGWGFIEEAHRLYKGEE